MVENITYKKHLFLDWPASVRKVLRRMTLASYRRSGMRDAVYNKRNPLTCVAFFNDIPIGWSLITAVDGLFKKDTIMVYVKYKFRRNGIGTELIKQLETPGIGCVSYNESSYYFWKEVEKKVVLDVDWRDF